MTCNYLVGRGKVAEVGEEEDLYVPGSAALAGKMYKTLMSQLTAGKRRRLAGSGAGAAMEVLFALSPKLSYE